MDLGAVLYVYRGDSNMPSIDFECLRAMFLVKYSNYPIKIDLKGNPFCSIGGKLPYLQIADKKFVGYQQIKEHLNEEKYTIDKGLSAKEQHLSNALVHWVFTNLHGYYYYFMFGLPKNYEISRELYANRMWFPLNCYYPTKYRKEAEDVVKIFGGFDINDKLFNHQNKKLELNAKICVNMLSKRLGYKEWFFGNKCSEFDAIVYSYLAILYYVQLEYNPLQVHLKGCPNLVQYIERITRQKFAMERSSSLLNKSSKLSASVATERRSLFMVAEKQTDMVKLSKILVSIVAVLFMSLFAIRNGVLQKINTLQSFDHFSNDEEETDMD